MCLKKKQIGGKKLVYNLSRCHKLKGIKNTNLEEFREGGGPSLG